MLELKVWRVICVIKKKENEEEYSVEIEWAKFAKIFGANLDDVLENESKDMWYCITKIGLLISEYYDDTDVDEDVWNNQWLGASADNYADLICRGSYMKNLGQVKWK